MDQFYQENPLDLLVQVCPSFQCLQTFQVDQVHQALQVFLLGLWDQVYQGDLLDLLDQVFLLDLLDQVVLCLLVFLEVLYDLANLVDQDFH